MQRLRSLLLLIPLALVLWWAGAAALHLLAGHRLFIDRPDGYALWVPKGWQADLSRLPVEARWTRPGATIRVLVQPVAGRTGTLSYVSYSNRSIDGGWNGIQRTAYHQGFWWLHPVWFRQWERPAMPALASDQRLYAEWDVALTPSRVLTVMVQAEPDAFAAAQADAGRIWRSVYYFPRRGENQYQLPHAPARPPALLPAVAGVQWGVYQPNLDADTPDFRPVDALNAATGGGLRLVLTYRGIGKPFPAELVRQATDRGLKVELTLQSWAPPSEEGRALPYGQGTSATGAILQGQFDDYFRQFARQVKAAGVPLFLRWDNEMNGDWDPWSAFQWGKDADLYVAAWRHIHDIFHAEGADNAVWIWNPNNFDLPPFRWNSPVLYYPGDAYVDWVGLTAYNLGNAQPGQSWRSFAELFRPAYEQMQALFPDKPLLITEFASHDAPGDKAAWVRQAVSDLAGFPAIRYAVWWDANQGDLHYSLGAPAAARQAFTEAVKRSRADAEGAQQGG